MPAITFKGKSLVHSHHLTIPYRQLLVDERRSRLAPGEAASLKGNVIIQGDNLHALKALIPSFAGKVKCIYIDPPYNTGNEHWVYNDNVAHPMLQEWLNQVVDKEDLTRHDKWLSMMTPRLKLLRELLRDDGMIFVSIDDNEMHRLRLLMDEIFGEENFRNCVVVPRGTKSVQSQFEEIDSLATGHDYLLIYTKSIESKLQKLQSSLGETEPGKWDTFWRGTDRPTMRYELFGQKPNTGQWRWNESRATKAVTNYQVYLNEFSHHFTLDEYFTDHLLMTGQKLDFVRLGNDDTVQYYVPPRSYKISSDVWMDLSTRGNYTDFPTEKPVDLISRILLWVTRTDQGDIILDSFAGSGTTAHAVLALNDEDGGNRRFILVEQEAYADTLTAERVRRVIQGIPTAKDRALQNGLGGSFTYCTLGPNFDENELLRGGLPAYAEMARFVFFTATGEQIDPTQIDEVNCYLGESSRYAVYLIYQPDIEYLKNTPLDLAFAMNLPVSNGKPRLIIASHKYLDEDRMAEYQIEFCQLPFGIYRYRAE
ncbi:MAG: site-specific DNA-methyltransferase [Caldilineaceae bacterium]